MPPEPTPCCAFYESLTGPLRPVSVERGRRGRRHHHSRPPSPSTSSPAPPTDPLLPPRKDHHVPLRLTDLAPPPRHADRRGATAALVAAGLAAAVAPAAPRGADSRPGGWARVAHLSPDNEVRRRPADRARRWRRRVRTRRRRLRRGQSLHPPRRRTYVCRWSPPTRPTAPSPSCSSRSTSPRASPHRSRLRPQRRSEDHRLRRRPLRARGGPGTRPRGAGLHVESSVDVDNRRRTRHRARDVPAGAATDYAAVPAGSWDLALTGADEAATSAVDLPAGSVSTVFVLDDATGSLTAQAITRLGDARRHARRGIHTGGGGTAPSSATPLGAVAGVAGVLVWSPWPASWPVAGCGRAREHRAPRPGRAALAAAVVVTVTACGVPPHPTPPRRMRPSPRRRRSSTPMSRTGGSSAPTMR